MHIRILNSLWLVIATTGFFFSATLLPAYLMALHGARRNPPVGMSNIDHHEAVILLGELIHKEATRFIVHILMLGMSIWSLFIPAEHIVYQHPRYVRAIVLTLLVSSFCCAHNSGFAWRSWHLRRERVAARLDLHRKERA